MPGLAAVRELWREYWDSLGFPDDFQGFAAELAALPGPYTLLIAEVDGEAAGSIALRPLRPGACEAKRLYVRPRFRGHGVARALFDRLIVEARAAGYREIYGDTMPSMQAALRMYRALGFVEVDAYSPNPTPGAVYLRLLLSGG